MRIPVTYTLVVLCLALICGVEATAGSPKNETTAAPTTVAPTTPAPTTVAPTTVAPTTAPTTVAPTTVSPTTVAPTTVAPTTVAPTTVAPTTAVITTAVLTTEITGPQTTAGNTASPSPPPKVFGNHLRFVDKSGKSCILENLNATFKVTDKDGTTFYTMDNARVINESSHCGDKAHKKPAILAMKWNDGSAHNFTQEFAVEKEYYYLKNVTVFLAAKHQFSFNLTDKMTMKTRFDHAFKCDTNTSVTNSTKKANLTVSLSGVLFQAFDVQKNDFSKKADSCPGDTPAPVPEPSWSNNLTVTYPNKSACILEIVNVTFTLTYQDPKNKTNTLTNVFNMTGATVIPGSSQCGNKTKKTNAIVAAKWGNNTMTQIFAAKGSYYYLQNITNLHLENATAGLVYNNKSIYLKDELFYTPYGNSLTCKSTQKVTCGDLIIEFTDVRFQAFDVVNNTFSNEHDCPGDNGMGNIVPIAVGAALAVLVVIVLIAYLIGRRNSSRTGYESV